MVPSGVENPPPQDHRDDGDPEWADFSMRPSYK